MALHLHFHEASARHGVTAEQIRQVLRRAGKVESIGDRAQAVGQDDSGQWIEVVFVADELNMEDVWRGADPGDAAILIIHAQPLSQFTKKRRKRRRRRT